MLVDMRLIKFHAIKLLTSYPCFQLIEIRYIPLFLKIATVSLILSQHGEIIQDFIPCTQEL